MPTSHSTDLPGTIKEFIDTLETQPDEHKLLQSLCQNIEIRSELVKLCRRDDDPYQQRVIDYLEKLPIVYSLITSVRAPQGLSTSEARRELGRLSKQAKKLAINIRASSNLVGLASSVDYLRKRISDSEESKSFSLRRMGLRGNSFLLFGDITNLPDLLDAFTEDIQEELEVFPKRLKSIDGGRDSHHRKLIRLLIKIYPTGYERPSTKLIAAIATHMLRRAGLFSVESEDIDPERVEYILKDKGKSLSK